MHWAECKPAGSAAKICKQKHTRSIHVLEKIWTRMLHKMGEQWKKYILWFAQEHVDFRLAEFNSIAKMFDLKYKNCSSNLLQPFWIVQFASDEMALKYASRSIALKCILELWSHGGSYAIYHQRLQRFVNENSQQLQSYFDKDCSFKINVETYNKHFSQREKIQKIETMDYLPLTGAVDLKQPKVEWWYIEFWGLDPNAVPEQPDDLLFGRLLAQGQRHLIKQLSLKQRKFIGNTSMDAQLSLLMANQAMVQQGDLVLDPFVGTGSLLVSAAKFGGYVLGADIDFMMIHARCRPSRITQKVREKDESIRANLQQYSCENRYLDVVVSDFSNVLWRNNLQFDCIITDPPYGIREATEKVQNKTHEKSCSRTEDMPHYPSTSHYALNSLYADLLVFAAKHLRLGGRLVCWLPFHREDYCEELLPQHACLQLVGNSEQPLTGLTCRRLLTYEKLYEPSSTDLEPKQTISNGEFRERYFDSGLESRTERRLRKAAQKEQGRLEALRRGKELTDVKQNKCNLNQARFS